MSIEQKLTFVKKTRHFSCFVVIVAKWRSRNLVVPFLVLRLMSSLSQTFNLGHVKKSYSTMLTSEIFVKHTVCWHARLSACVVWKMSHHAPSFATHLRVLHCIACSSTSGPMQCVVATRLQRVLLLNKHVRRWYQGNVVRTCHKIVLSDAHLHRDLTRVCVIARVEERAVPDACSSQRHSFRMV